MKLRLAYAVLGTLLLGYFAFLLLRSSQAFSPLMDGWLVVAIELGGAMLCMAAGLRGGRARPVALVLGAAALSWTIGDLVLTIESLGGAEPPTPSLADGFYLGFFPLAYAGIFLFMRGEVRRLSTPTWLDSIVAALGAGAVCAAFAFQGLLHGAGESTLATATNLAYPVGDLLLLALVAGSAAMLAGRRPGPWLLLGGGMLVNAAGDTFNLFGSSVGSTHVGTIVNAVAWPTSILLISAAMWMDPGHPDPLAPPKPPGFLLPGIATLAALTILVVASFSQIEAAAVALATATMLAVGLRLAISVRGLRRLTDERQRQSVTDHLTGLGNRRRLFDVLGAFFADQPESAGRRRRMAFLYIDLDRFKEINDSFWASRRG